MAAVANTPRTRSGNRVTNGLVALGSAAVLAVYSAGYVKTRAAAKQLAAAEGPPRAVVPAPLTAAPLTIPTAEPARATTAPPPVPRKKIPRSTPVPVRRANTPSAEPAPAPVSVETPTPAAATPPPVPTPADVKPPEPEPKPAAATPYKDGTYYGWGTSRHGDIQAAVTIEKGRITAASIAQCLTRYSCSWIAMLPPQVVTRQSADVDFVSGATQSTNAFYYAVLDALAKAK